MLLLLCVGCGAEEGVAQDPPGAATRYLPEAEDTPSEGKYYPIPRNLMNAAQRQEAAALESIGYAAGGDEAGDSTGLVTYEVDLTQPGERLFISGHGPTGILVAADGRVLHEWGCFATEVFTPSELQDGQRAAYWRRAMLLPQGDILAMFTHAGLVRLDRESNVVWTHAGRVHHDFDRDDEGGFWVLERETNILEWLHPERPVLHDQVVHLSADGEFIQRVSLVDCILRSSYRDEIEQQLLANFARGLEAEARVREEKRDIFEAEPEKLLLLNMVGNAFHTNTLQWLDGRHAEGRPHFARGNVLLCIRNLGRVVVIDPSERRVVWQLPGLLRTGMHEPQLLENGNLLLFDNKGPEKREGLKAVSEVVEVDPDTGEVVWSYRADRRGRFYSPIAGTCQRLANGNTLITQSTAGRVFEVSPEGQVVWDFLSPFRAGENDRLIAFLPDMQVVQADWLEEER